MKLKQHSPNLESEFASIQRRRVGAKAFYIEPWLILGASLLWVLVLPLAGLFWSGNALARRVSALPL